jgi:hypothetical protein
MQNKIFKQYKKKKHSNKLSTDSSFFPYSKEKLNYIIIDPGIKNLCICYPKKKKIWLFHFDSVNEMIKSKCFLDFLNEIEQDESLNILCEDQVVKKNLIVQGFVCGLVLQKLKMSKLFFFQPSLKNYNARYFFNYKYSKIKSKKAYESMPLTIKNYLLEWKIFEIIGDKINEKHIIEVKKKDDIIDCILISKF